MHHQGICSFLRTENCSGSGRTGQGNVDIMEGVDGNTLWKGWESLQQAGAGIHHGRTAKPDPELPGAQFHGVPHQLARTPGGSVPGIQFRRGKGA